MVRGFVWKDGSMFYVVAHNPVGMPQAGHVYGPFKSHDAAQRFVEDCERNGLIAATRRTITVDEETGAADI